MNRRILKTLFYFSLFSLVPSLSLAQEDESDKIENKMVRSINDFAFVLNTNLVTEPGINSVFSPLSLFSSLTLVDLGAKSLTSQEISKALQLMTPLSEISSRLSKFIKGITPDPKNPSFTLSYANGLWLEQDMFILSSFRHTAQDVFDAKIESLNFSNEEKTLSIINEWTSNQTKGKIKNLLKSGDISSSTRMLITNCLDFEGSWLNPFDESKTKTAPFTPDSNTSIAIKMMDQEGSYPYFENAIMQMVALPIEGKTQSGSSLALIIILPEKNSTLMKTIGALTSFTFEQWMEALDVRKVHLSIPKFTLTKRYELNEALASMGMKEAFTNAADFSGINGMKDLFLSKVFHQAVFIFDEKGLSASSASAASINMKATRPIDEKPFEFLADHPFIFAIADTQSKAILFLGSFSTPDTGNTP